MRRHCVGQWPSPDGLGTDLSILVDLVGYLAGLEVGLPRMGRVRRLVVMASSSWALEEQGDSSRIHIFHSVLSVSLVQVCLHIYADRHIHL